MHLVPPKDQRLKVTVVSNKKSETLKGDPKDYFPKIEEILNRAGCEWVDKDPNYSYFLVPLINPEIIRICHTFLEMAKRDEKKQPGPNIIPSNLKMEFSRFSSNEETIPSLTKKAVG